MMEQHRREQPPAGHQTAFENIVVRDLALMATQGELDQIRAAWELKSVRLAPPDFARTLLATESSGGDAWWRRCSYAGERR